MKRKWPLIIVGLVVVAQLIPLDRSHPPVTAEVPAPDEVRSILQRSCYDCHSNENRWPWYGYVAPVSWLLAYDIHEAREHVNFSEWDRYDAGKQAKNLEEVWEEVEEGEMPLSIYTLIHSEAKLSESDKAALRAWTQEGARER